MKKAMAMLVLLLGLSLSVRAQALPAGTTDPAVGKTTQFYGYDKPTISATAQWGDCLGIGYKLPCTDFGVQVQYPFLRIFEIDDFFSVTPNVKTFAQSGFGLSNETASMIWITRHIAASVGYSGSIYWSATPNGVTNELNGTQVYTYGPDYSKGQISPFIGAVLYDPVRKHPGRLYLSYYIPTGCQWATPTNPCTVQSSRTSELAGLQEWELWPRVRVGVTAAWVNYADQSNQNDPAAGRTWHNTWEASATLKVVLHQAK